MRKRAQASTAWHGIPNGIEPAGPGMEIGGAERHPGQGGEAMRGRLQAERQRPPLLHATPACGRHARMNSTLARDNAGRPAQKTLTFGSYPSLTLVEARHRILLANSGPNLFHHSRTEPAFDLVRHFVAKSSDNGTWRMECPISATHSLKLNALWPSL
jgi:hypothetical protein